MTPDDKPTATDLLGVAPYGEALNTIVKKTFEGLEGFLKNVCVQALGELGLMLKDEVRYWRLCNILRIIEKSKGKLEFVNDQIQMKAHPRVAMAIIEHGSLIDNNEAQELWAGLFASACSEDGQQDDNLIFVDLLRQLTFAEAKILKFICLRTRKILHKNGLVTAEHLYCQFDELSKLTGIHDIHNMDRQLDHLRSLELIAGGFSSGSADLTADITPTDLALNLYVRSQGFSKSTADFWKSELITSEYLAKEQAEKSKAEADNLKREAETIKEV